KLSAIIKAEQAGEGAEKGEAKDASPKRLKVEGIVRFKADSFTYKRFTWKPLHADISMEAGKLGIEVKKASTMCGISTPGVINITGGEISLDFKPVAENFSVESANECLYKEQKIASGTANLHAEIRAKGDPDKLLNSLEGSLDFSTRDGQIYKDASALKILNFLNFTEVFRGRFPHIGETGFHYSSGTLKGNIKEGKLKIHEGILDGDPADIVFEGEIGLADNDMDLTVLVAPAKTANWLIRHTPIIRRIMGGTLVTVPLKVTGPRDNLEIKTIAPDAVGGGLTGMLKRTITMPFALFHADPSEEKK
ncbi:MAG: AsmA-like C-terminal region-containing protein, partial [Deltaproteobacteria bacterium]|nr:AsmA-like C-terminal region-containing protein [Deltaproteobacteria bacterium]